MRQFVLPLFFILLVTPAFSQKDSAIVRKNYTTERAVNSPKIDGILDDEVWKEVPVMDDLRQSNPYFNTKASQRTAFQISYDNTAIYIAGKLYDTAPDSISRQLGNRDDALNADYFRIVFDTYNKEQDAFVFIVYASGVQSDMKFSDGNYNAIWESAVKIDADGWSVEMKIPYSALRFPNAEEQLWGLQVTRYINRRGENDQWALTPKGASNFYKYWGFLRGIEHIKPPLRISLTPYLTSSLSHYPANIAGESNYSFNVSGGMDLKYGLNESFTLDATLLPDFSQVQSDNLVKNLSAFEVQYDEQRPFFQENTDLFSKGDLFYSRRIGRTPGDYYSVYDQLQAGETVVKNPDQAKLLNATKVSGRTVDGLGLGIMNAVMDNTYAVVKDSLGNERKIRTEPFSNYNIFVLDKQLKNSSSFYLINTNLTRKHDGDNADVTGSGFSLKNKKNSYSLDAQAAVSNNYTKRDTVENQYTDLFGYKYDLNFSKTSGKFQFMLYRSGMNPTFDNNGLGITNETNYFVNGIWMILNQFEPNRIFLNSNINIDVSQAQNFSDHRRNSMDMSVNMYGQFKNMNYIYLNANGSPVDGIDYYEARTPGRIFVRTKNIIGFLGFGTDTRKQLSVAINTHFGTTGLISNTIGYNPFYGGNETTTFRANDKFSCSLQLAFHIDDGDRGWVYSDPDGTIVFGVRKITNVENILTARYLFKNNLSLSLRARHYWAKAHYSSFYDLMENGHLADDISYEGNHDFNFNTFNVDMVFQWQFAPGSSLNFVWKNSINNEADATVEGYFHDLNQTFEADQLNIFSLKLLYYFDYLYLKKKQSK